MLAATPSLCLCTQQIVKKIIENGYLMAALQRFIIDYYEQMLGSPFYSYFIYWCMNILILFLAFYDDFVLF